MKKMIKALLGGLVLSMVLVALFPSAFLKDDAKWTFQSNVGRVDIAFAGDVQNGCLEVLGNNVRTDEPKWLLDNRHNQGVMVSFPVSYLKRTYKITLQPRGDAREMSLEMSFRGPDLRIHNQRKPAYVCFENIRVNGKTVAEEQTVWHDKPFRYHAKNMLANSTVTLSFDVRKPLTSSDVEWVNLIGLFIVVGLVIFCFDALRKLGNKGSIFTEREEGMQCNIKDGAQRLHAVEFLGNRDKKSSDDYTLPSEYASPAGKFKNIELLRFLMAWSVAGFHAMHVKSFAPYGLSFLVNYTGKGSFAVPYFFVISFFFLVLKTRPDCSGWKFVRNKWLRMAPLIIVVTLIAYVIHLNCGFWGGEMSANLEQFLLLHDRCPADRWSKFVGPAYFCSVLFLSSVLYLSWIKTLSAKHVALVVTSVAFIGLVLWRTLPQLPNSTELGGVIDYSRGFAFLGISYVLATIFVATPPARGLVTPFEQSHTRTLLYTVPEILFLGLFVASLYGAHWYKLSELLSVLFFACLFYLFIRKEGYLSRLLERDWCVWLGRYAFGIFIIHWPVFRIAKEILLPGHEEWALAHPWCLLGGMACVIMLLSMLGYHYIEVPIMRYIKSK